MSYVPRPYANEVWSYLQGSGFDDPLLKYLSQTYGCVSMDVRENTPHEMTFPFVCPQPMLRLFNNSSAV